MAKITSDITYESIIFIHLCRYGHVACSSCFTGCRSSKGTVSSDGYPSISGQPTVTAVSPLKSITDNYRDWTDVSVPVTLRLVSPKNMSVSARARMVRGRCIDL